MNKDEILRKNPKLDGKLDEITDTCERPGARVAE